MNNQSQLYAMCVISCSIKQACMSENTTHYHDINMVSVLDACIFTASVSNLLHEYCASFAFIMFISESQHFLEIYDVS